MSIIMAAIVVYCGASLAFTVAIVVLGYRYKTAKMIARGELPAKDAPHTFTQQVRS